VWDGHTWAEGAANDNVGTNLESSSEAMDYDGALILYGQATGNTALRDLGVYLYTSELEGVRTYWFSQKNKTDPFGNQTNVIPAAYLGTPGASLTGTTTSGETTLTLGSASSQVVPGQRIFGPGIAPDTTVKDVNGTMVTLSLKAVAGAGTGTFTFGGTQRTLAPKLNDNGGSHLRFIGFPTPLCARPPLLPVI